MDMRSFCANEDFGAIVQARARHRSTLATTIDALVVFVAGHKLIARITIKLRFQPSGVHGMDDLTDHAEVLHVHVHVYMYM